MILIADSGSTKTDWAIVTSGQEPVVINTQGINPVHQSREEIVRILREEFGTKMTEDPDVRRLKSSNILTPQFPYAVYFYGSGVRPEMESLMTSLLRSSFARSKYSCNKGLPLRPPILALTRLITPTNSGASNRASARCAAWDTALLIRTTPRATAQPASAACRVCIHGCAPAG